jgi:hypothetical protein
MKFNAGVLKPLAAKRCQLTRHDYTSKLLYLTIGFYESDVAEVD